MSAVAPSPGLTEYAFRPPQAAVDPDNALFLERLDAFVQKSLAEIQAFAERESRSYEETRRYVAEWHVNYLFGTAPHVAGASQHGAGERVIRVRDSLVQTSKALESLAEVTGVQSFLLAVDPHNPQDAGFLGGSLIGREFYRGLRGGGNSGASIFKTYALKRLPSSQDNTNTRNTPSREASARSARQSKIDLYEVIRSQLRKTSGIRKAEMKWTNPERLNLYGVRLVGWPPDIPAANPSNLKASQNQRLLELVQRDELRFEKTMVTGIEAPVLVDTSQSTSSTTAEDFSWAYDADGGEGGAGSSSSSMESAAKAAVTTSPALLLDPIRASSPGVSPVEGNNLGSSSTWKGDSHQLITAENEVFVDYSIEPDIWNHTLAPEEQEACSPIERRTRKRRRSSGGEDRQ